MKQNYIAPAVESIKVIADQMMASQSDLAVTTKRGKVLSFLKNRTISKRKPFLKRKIFGETKNKEKPRGTAI